MAEITPPRRDEFLTPNGLPTRRFIEYLESLTRQTNTTTTNVTTIQNEITVIEGDIVDTNLKESYPWPSLDLPVGLSPLRAVTVTGNYTANAFDFINAKANAQITFPKYPDENGVIIVRNGDGSSIKLVGNGKNINGSSTGVLRRKNTSIEFHYFIESDEWFAR